MPDASNPIRQLFQIEHAPGFAGVLQRVLAIHRLTDLYGSATRSKSGTIFDGFLESLRVTPVVTDADLARIPKSGPVVVVANHPFGLIEGAILGNVLGKVRPDFRIMANFLLEMVPEFQKHFIFVDPFGGRDSTRANLRGMKASMEFLENEQGVLAVFPAGEVAHMQFHRGEITDPDWNQNVARLIRRTGATVVPMYFDGANSALFHLAGMIHPRLRTALLPHELLNKHDRALELRIGAPISPSRLAQIEPQTELTAYLRHRTFLLRHRTADAPNKILSWLPKFPKAAQEPIADPVDAPVLEAEVAKLRPLLSQGEYAVYLASAGQIPNVLHEIAGLREITFRSVDEGTGTAADSDAYDGHYKHLFVWRSDARYVVGAYRLGETDQILQKYGRKGLYTSSLFSYKREFLTRIGPALELGRSFVRIEEQRNYVPLLLLWRGIGAYVAANPRFRILFGPVSISGGYQRASRQLIVSFFRNLGDPRGLAKLVRGRNPFGIRPTKAWGDFGNITAWSLDELSECVAELEQDQKGVPVLLRQYMKLGGKLLAFNVDGNFSNALDGLILVDLMETDPRMVERYLGKDGAKSFFAYQHSLAPSLAAAV